MRKQEIIASAKINEGLINYYILEKELNNETGVDEYGIKIEFITENSKYSETVEYFGTDFLKIKNIIYTLKRNTVTPLGLYDVLIDNFIVY